MMPQTVQDYKCQQATAAANSNPLVDTPDWRANDVGALKFDQSQLQSDLAQEKFVQDLLGVYSGTRVGVAAGRVLSLAPAAALGRSVAFGPAATVLAFVSGAAVTADLARTSQRLKAVNAQLNKIEQCGH